MSADITRGLGIEYALVYIVLGVASALALIGYRVTRAGHAENLAAIEALALGVEPS